MPPAAFSRIYRNTFTFPAGFSLMLKAGIMRVLRILLCGAGVLVALSASASAGAGPRTLGGVSSVIPLENGIRIVTINGGIEEITALRDDIVRVRASASSTLPEDASWAVLEKSRTASVPITSENTASTVGFRTQLLHVEIDRKTLCLTVSNRDGRILQQDAQPIRFEDSAFRIMKSMPADEHYYGLGDKTGPTDRRGRAF